MRGSSIDYMGRRGAKRCVGASFCVVDGVCVRVERKDVRYLRLRVARGDGGVCVSVPLGVSDVCVEDFLKSHWGWVVRRRAFFEERERLRREREGCGVFLLGRFYEFRFFEDSKASAAVMGDSVDLFLPDGDDLILRVSLVDGVLRSSLMGVLNELVPYWSGLMGVCPQEWRIRKMHTRWGTCNTVARRIWFSLELGKFSRRLIEYVVVHELCHLLERGHSSRFYAFMDKFLPDWRVRKGELNSSLF